MRKAKILAVVVALASVMLMVALPASAGDVPCAAPGTTVENVLVPPGASCVLTNVTVKGNVKVLQNANLITNGTTTILGSAYGEGSDTFGLDPQTDVKGNVHVTKFVGPTSLCGTDIGGDVLLKEGTVSSRFFIGIPGLGCPGNMIHGNVTLYDNESSSSVVFGNVIQINRNEGNLQAYKNTGGQLRILNNVIAGNLQCFENVPPPQSASNTAQQKQGQCLN